MSRARLNQIYTSLVITAGAAALLFSLREFPLAQLDIRFLLMALATYLALGLGSRVIQAGLRRLLETTRQRMLSLFQIGLRWLKFCLSHDRPLPNSLSPVPS